MYIKDALMSKSYMLLELTPKPFCVPHPLFFSSPGVWYPTHITSSHGIWESETLHESLLCRRWARIRYCWHHDVSINNELCPIHGMHCYGHQPNMEACMGDHSEAYTTGTKGRICVTVLFGVIFTKHINRNTKIIIQLWSDCISCIENDIWTCVLIFAEVKEN